MRELTNVATPAAMTTDAAPEAPPPLQLSVARDRWGGDLTGAGAPTVPRSIVRAAVERRLALLSVDAAADPRFGGLPAALGLVAQSPQVAAQAGTAGAHLCGNGTRLRVVHGKGCNGEK